MRLQVLHVPGCPNAGTLITRLGQLGHGPAQVKQHVVHDQDQAAALRMSGSPTLLVDGVDPFAVPGQPPSLSCRLYHDEHGTLTGAPSVAQLREAINRNDGGKA